MYDTLIRVQELHAHAGDPGWVIVDCRYDLMDRQAGYRTYLAGHVPGAAYADLHDDLSGPPVTDHGRHPLPDAERLCRLFSELGIEPGVQVVAYDDAAGSIAARLWWMLRYMNHQAVAVLDGGWQAWLDAGFAIEEPESRRRSGIFRGAPDRRLLAVIDEVAAVRCLVDARDPVRYRGETEPLDPVAGHIPGARNRFWKCNLDADGNFLPAHRLRDEFGALYDGAEPAEVVFYCGSGVSACHDILAAVHAGLPFPRLYAGSWSEWCSDRSRPIATGDH
jgi:thiosulfate/3-mercaptopyruvate sulfurtransferase